MDNQYIFHNYEKKKYLRLIESIKNKYINDNISEWRIELDNLFRNICTYYWLSTSMINKIILSNDARLYDKYIYTKLIHKYNIIDEIWGKENLKYLQLESKSSSSITIFMIWSTEYTSLPWEEYIFWKSAYIINNWYPYFLSETKWWFASEGEESSNSWVTKDLVILLGSLILSFNWRLSDVTLNKSFAINIPNNIYKGKINKKVLKYIKEHIYIYEYVYKIVKNTRYKFNNNTNKDRFLNISSSIDREEHILLKVIYYLYKSSSLSSNYFYYEESMWLLFFSLEGIIKLIMLKYDIKEVKNVWKFLNKKFGLYDFSDAFEEIYDARIEYVHAMNDISYEWCSSFTWHHFEVFDIVWTLIDIYLFEEHLDNYPL